MYVTLLSFLTPFFHNIYRVSDRNKINKSIDYATVELHN